MMSKSTLKRKPLASQKVRRRWVISYVLLYAVAFCGQLVNFSQIQQQGRNVFLIQELFGAFSMVVFSIVAITGYVTRSSVYRDMAMQPSQSLDERQAIVRYRATELCFEIVIGFFLIAMLYVYFAPLIGLQLPDHDETKRLLLISNTFVWGLRTAMIAWLEPDPIEEAPTF